MRSPLLEELIDYAGVFPPAALPVADARAEYEQARASEHGWVLGPMLVLASQLDELETPSSLGLVADVAIPADAPPLAQVERRTTVSGASAAIAELRTAAPVLYLECTDPDDLGIVEPIATARSVGIDVRAKIRTGGATATAFPTPEAVAAFITACVTHAVPFKATAGLHHPVRHPSYVDGAVEHGFFNVLAATRCALTGDEDATLAALRSTEQADFDVATATFRGVGAGLDPVEVRATFRSIGSCSFDEPTGYLADLGML